MGSEATNGSLLRSPRTCFRIQWLFFIQLSAQERKYILRIYCERSGTPRHKRVIKKKLVLIPLAKNKKKNFKVSWPQKVVLGPCMSFRLGPDAKERGLKSLKKEYNLAPPSCGAVVQDLVTVESIRDRII